MDTHIINKIINNKLKIISKSIVSCHDLNDEIILTIIDNVFYNNRCKVVITNGKNTGNVCGDKCCNFSTSYCKSHYFKLKKSQLPE